ncbi:hypothetical protein DDD64_07785 [Actinotignum sanguinis]|uniref:LuxR C-terminal-related transcriptional regulator n=1 Tax=Actinotignum sanguinis TaxID=1445614 RepID=UPI000F7F3DEB|nr:LuxR C-terminal-related transcriptional regulator [Actinotignum sanguinis]MDY5148338.1 LuxR C-terminal-related transcriptional regulator [Actinotignum sanguinis]RTE47866.1 hypothetical protein DDD64_07785 [Actinotignum sanguinis]
MVAFVYTDTRITAGYRYTTLTDATNKNIARRTGLTETTVRSYVSDILNRTGCATRAELGITAIKAGITG